MTAAVTSPCCEDIVTAKTQIIIYVNEEDRAMLEEVA